MNCLNKINGCTNQVYEKNGAHWTKCLDCLRASYVPKSGKDTYWYKSAMFWKAASQKNKEHYYKMMRRHSIRMQKYRRLKRILKDIL